MNKTYDYVEGTSALSISEEQTREGYKFMCPWLEGPGNSNLNSTEERGGRRGEKERARARARIRTLSPRNRPEDAFALGLWYLAWGEYEACAAATEGCQRESSFTSWITVLLFVLISTSITTPTTSAPVSVQVSTLSTPVSFPSQRQHCRLQARIIDPLRRYLHLVRKLEQPVYVTMYNRRL